MESKFSMRLKQQRTALNMSQKTLAEVIGASPASVSAYETGAKLPAVDTAFKIAQTLGVTVDWLCGVDATEIKDIPCATMGDVARIYLKLIDIFDGIKIEIVRLDPANDDTLTDENRMEYISFGSYYNSSGELEGDESIDTSDWACLSIRSSEMSDFLDDYKKMSALLHDHTINRDLFNTWLDGKLISFDLHPVVSKIYR